MTEVHQVVYFTVAATPTGEQRLGPPYADRKTARSWLRFVSKARRASARVVECRLRWVDGKLDADSVARLDGFNMDPPEETPCTPP